MLFESIEGYVEWTVNNEQKVFYTKLTETALQGMDTEDDVMPSEYVTLSDYVEAVLGEGDEGTFVLIPSPEEGADTLFFRAADTDEAAQWVKAINDILSAVPMVEEAPEESYSNEAHGAVAPPQQYDRQPSDHQGLSHPNPNPSAVPQQPPAFSRLQPYLEQPEEQQEVPPATVAPTYNSGANSNTYVVRPRGGGELENGLTQTPRAPPAGNTNGNPAIRTTTYTVHDEYRQGGVPQSRYEETDAWVRGNAHGAASTSSNIASPASQRGYQRQQSAAASDSNAGWGNPSDAGGAAKPSNSGPYGRQGSSNNGWGSAAPSNGGGNGRAPLRPQDHNSQSYGQSQSPLQASTVKANSVAPNGNSNGYNGRQQQQQFQPPQQQQQQPHFHSNGGNQQHQHGYGQGGGGGGNNNASYQVNEDPSTVLGRKRSGMFVNVPANQQLNKNVAPNVSAMWKQWTDETSGDLYVFHEPTGTLQCRPAGSDRFETYVKGSEDIPDEDLAHHPYPEEDDTMCDMNGNVVRNIQNYGTQRFGGTVDATSADVYRNDVVMTPRGQYSPTRKSRVTVQAAPREKPMAYEGRRVHHLSISAGPRGDEAVIEHSVQPLDTNGLMWDPRTGQTVDMTDKEGTNARNIGQATLYKQWEHVRSILSQGRYFKKHAVNKASYSYRFAFLTGDNAYVVCVPTSEVMLNVHTSVRTFNSVSDTIQYYGRDAKAIALNNITRVTLGTEESSISRRKDLRAQNTFCIVTQTHAFVLECESSKEARYFADAWNFFLHHSGPMNIQAQRTKQMRNPVTHGTRAGLAF